VLPNAPCISKGLIAVGLTATILTTARGTQSRAGPAPETIACRVIESKTALTLGVELVVFHHAEAAAREQLGAFLENHDGASVEFEIAGGGWQPATEFRLKSCFGRGLLAFPAARVHLVRGQTFWIRASAGAQ
jgi:hypothetical protein